MLRKKQVILQTKEAAVRPNAKVTVQYIQPQQVIIRRTPITIANANRIMSTPTTAAEELEIVENVEYLEETVAADDLIEEQTAVVAKRQEEQCDDLFYPNAIYCLLDLYKEKYENVITNVDDHKVLGSQIWRDIAKDMQERYFEFEAEQIRQKFCNLRQHYFEIKTIEDIENFEYFEQIHDIYKDSAREAIAKGSNLTNISTSVVYKDENVISAVIYEDAHEVRVTDFKSEEIVHKEHEFIDMVEKELQAMEEDDQMAEQQIKVEKINNEICGDKVEEPTRPENPENNEHSVLQHKSSSTSNEPSLKRHLSHESQQASVKQKPKLDENEDNGPTPQHYLNNANNNIQPINNNDASLNSPSSLFSLYHYNEEQERRHREKIQLLKEQQQQRCDQISLLEKSLKLHEKTLEQQNLLLQELIKRFPPS